MTFADLLNGDSLFLDANTLVYHFEPHPVLGPACTQLLARIERQDLMGFISTHILTEVAHRLMMVEASRLPGSSPTKVKLASNDTDFDRVPGVTRFAPT